MMMPLTRDNSLMKHAQMERTHTRRASAANRKLTFARNKSKYSLAYVHTYGLLVDTRDDYNTAPQSAENDPPQPNRQQEHATINVLLPRLTARSHTHYPNNGVSWRIECCSSSPHGQHIHPQPSFLLLFDFWLM